MTDSEYQQHVVDAWDGHTAWCLCCGTTMTLTDRGATCGCGQNVSISTDGQQLYCTILPRLYPSKMCPGSALDREYADWWVIESVAALNIAVLLGMSRAARDAKVQECREARERYRVKPVRRYKRLLSRLGLG
jgi:hypothetical protein